MSNQLFKNPSTTAEQLIQVANHYNIKLNAIVYKSHLQNIKPEIGCYIINMANNAPGSHWIGLVNFMINGKPESYYYDPFGFVPAQEVIQFCKRFGDVKYTRGREFQQNPNNGFCGGYVMLFLIYMSFNQNLSPNDRLKKFNKLFINHSL